MANNYNDVRGSVWRKWDLHSHTPIDPEWINRPKLDSEEDKKKFAKEYVDFAKQQGLEVIAITDHNFCLDKKDLLIPYIQEEAITKNITILPGFEITAKDGSGVHLLVIFPQDTSLDKIDGVVNQLFAPNQERIKDGAIVGSNKTIDEIKSTIEEAKLQSIFIFAHADGDNGILNSKTINGERRAQEWQKDFINICQLSRCLSEFKNGGFESNVVNNIDKNYSRKMSYIIASDCRTIVESEANKERNYLGQKFSWIKADPTFDGLKQIIYEPEDRIYIGEIPPVIERVAANKTKYINSLVVNGKNGYDEKQGVWFKNVDIKFNKELVAIIGNKGSGKSAISDIIGLLGNTHNAGEKQENLSFLNGKNLRFRKRGYAENFEAELIWEDKSGISVKIPLNRDVDVNQKEKVKYLPQNYFESLTNDLEGLGFDRTLKSVIFLHIPEEDRLGNSTFEELEDEKIKNIEIDLNGLRADIHNISEDIIKYEKKKHPSNKKILDNFILEKQKELDEHDKNKPAKVDNPSEKKGKKEDAKKTKQYAELEALNTKYQEIAKSIISQKSILNSLTKEKEELSQIYSELIRLESQSSDYKDANKAKFSKYGLNIDDIIKTEFNHKLVKTALEKRIKQIKEINYLLKSKESIEADTYVSKEEKQKVFDSSLVIQQEVAQNEIDKIKNDLSQPERDFQVYKEKLSGWEEKRKEIEGTDSIPDTLKYYKAEKLYINSKLPAQLEVARVRRISKAMEIFKKKKEIIELYNTFKKSIDELITKDKEFLDKFRIEIEADFKIVSDFSATFLGFINKSKCGTYRGAEEKQVKELFVEKNLLDDKDVSNILNSIISNLERDERAEVKESEKEVEISDQIEKIGAFYDYIFSLEYLKPIYELKLDGKTLNELSPGEKGALLLVFYLMIDKDDTPLIIDQPEDNLDNKSVFQVLTHFIKNAKKRRQIIIVTHNPNLAVGADAEQIIYVELDKKNKNTFSYELGGIENPLINKRIVEILEGTMPAFDKRKLKYFKEN